MSFAPKPKIFSSSEKASRNT